MDNRYAFVGGSAGSWSVASVTAVSGSALSFAPRVDVAPLGGRAIDHSAAWVLHGLKSNIRYATRGEVTTLRAIQEPLGRPEARLAALIPIKKSQAWWDLAQDERRAIFEEQSQHTALGVKYLPAVSRQLYHCRDLGEPFDFLTWFEYAPEHASAFDDLVSGLRATKEWSFVEREIDFRLERCD